MFKAIIIDDEKANRESLQLDLKEYCPEIQVKALCASGEEGLSAIHFHKPDLVFLDIEMPNMTGFEMLERLPKLSFSLIFVTAYQHYAIEAFEKNAIAYLLKPISSEKLISAVQKAISKRIKQTQISTLLKNIDSLRRQVITKSVILKTNNGDVSMNISSILYAESDGNFCRIYLEDGRKYFISSLLKNLETKLPHQFCRIHRQTIVNKQQIHSYIPGDGGTVLLINGKKLTVSRRYKKDFLANYSF